jgi:hypothetical protein
LILRRFSPTTLQSNPVALVLEALGCDESLNLGGFGVGFLAFAFWFYFAADDKFADYQHLLLVEFSLIGWKGLVGKYVGWEGVVGGRRREVPSSSLLRPKNLRILVARLGPRRLG